MVLKLRFQRWTWLPALVALHALPAVAGRAEAERDLAQARELFSSGQFFKAARYAFSAGEEDGSVLPQADSLIAVALARAGLHQASTYFFIKTLERGDREASRRVLGVTEELLAHVGVDMLREFLVRHTNAGDYNDENRSAYAYAVGKKALLRGKEREAVRALEDVSTSSHLYPAALQISGTARAILGDEASAISDFSRCADLAENAASRLETLAEAGERGQLWASTRKREAQDLKSRCQAGAARTMYQSKRFEDADRTYDAIDKRSLVWPDILFEQAWSAFAQGEHNRALGKLVTYKSPSLEFVFNPEIDSLRAQSFLALCLYDDANDAVNDFNRKYGGLGANVKRLVESRSGDLTAFFNDGKEALEDRLHTTKSYHRLLNRFVRSPYFRNLVASEVDIDAEKTAISRFDSLQSGVEHRLSKGFPGFLRKVLGWRLEAIRFLGGAFVQNSLMDYHQELLSEFDRVSFIKLEMLKRAKDKLLNQRQGGGRSRGTRAPSRRDDQYYWSFNGEFWADEMGDYVFGLESECGA